MKINLFEGFKRFNQIIIAMIFVVGICIVLNQSVSIDKTIYHKDKDYREMGDEIDPSKVVWDKPQNTVADTKENKDYFDPDAYLASKAKQDAKNKKIEFTPKEEAEFEERYADEQASKTKPQTQKNTKSLNNFDKLSSKEDLDALYAKGIPIENIKPAEDLEALYANATPVNECIDSYQSTKYLEEGSVYFTFCFDQKYEYESMRDFAENYQIAEAEKADLNKQLHGKWLQNLIQNIGYVFLSMLGYFIFCKVVKYIAVGFIRK